MNTEIIIRVALVAGLFVVILGIHFSSTGLTSSGAFVVGATYIIHKGKG